MLKPMLPYLLQEALGVYGQRQSTFGRTPMDFSPLQAMLGQYMNRYTGGTSVADGQGIRNAAMANIGGGGRNRNMDNLGRFQRSYDAF